MHKGQRDIANRVTRVIGMLRPGHRVGEVVRQACLVLQCYCPAWPDVFPQHGPGRKSQRPIILHAWQRDVLEHDPIEFIRGCIDSDGSRHRRIAAGRNYPAYTFKNYSGDILQLFVEACRLAGLSPNQSNRVTISIARRADVNRLDGLFGVPNSVDSVQATESSSSPDVSPIA